LFPYFARFFVGLVFIVAGMAKLGQTEAFVRAIENYRLLPATLVRPVAVWLPRIEFAAGTALTLGFALIPLALAVSAMLLAFSGAVAINLIRGREMSCNCFGSASPERMTWLTVARNLVLALMSLSVALSPPAVLSIWASAGSSTTTMDTENVIAAFFIATSALLMFGLVGQAWRVSQTASTLGNKLSQRGHIR
jgi:uncharacterized membrane protein YphA (DoxX/SURF4 family)